MSRLSSVLNLEPEQIKEVSMVDIAFEILQSKKKPYYYRELLDEIAEMKGMSEDEKNNSIAQLYTEMNIDGRFVCVGQNLWGLKRWYPVDKQEDAAEGVMARDDDDDDLSDIDIDEVANNKKKKKAKKAKAKNLDDDDLASEFEDDE